MFVAVAPGVWERKVAAEERRVAPAVVGFWGKVQRWLSS